MELDKIQELLKNYTKYTHKQLTSIVRECLKTLIEEGNTTIKQASFLLAISEEKINQILNDEWDGFISTNTLCRLFVITFGVFPMPGCDLSEIDTSRIRNAIGDYLTQTSEPEELYNRTKTINSIFDVIRTLSDNDIKSLEKAINEIVIDNMTTGDDKKDCKEKVVEKEAKEDPDGELGTPFHPENWSRGCKLNITKDENDEGQVNGCLWADGKTQKINFPFDKERVDKFLQTLLGN